MRWLEGKDAALDAFRGRLRGEGNEVVAARVREIIAANLGAR